MNNAHKIAVLISCWFLAASCKKDDSVADKQFITGSIRLINEFGRDIEDKSGITVSFDGLGDKYTSTTTKDGAFKVRAAKGKNTLTFSRSDVGTYKIVDRTFSGKSEQIPLIKLGNLAISSVYNLQVKKGVDKLYITGVMLLQSPSNLLVRKHRLFFHPTLPAPLRGEYTLTTSGTTNLSLDQFEDTVTFQELRAAGIEPGSEFMVAAYGDNVNADTYLTSEGKRIFPAISSGRSNIVISTY